MALPCFVPADILLPSADTPLDPWACIAVDQFTSQPEYWQRAEQLAQGHPSTLHIVLPEAYLGTPQATAAVLEKYKFVFQKKYGQNFFLPRVPANLGK